jgi:hypothetical protein
VLISPHIDFKSAQSIKYKELPWTKIAAKIKTRSKDDCRNRFFLQVYNTFFQKSYFDEKLEVKLLRYIEEQGFEEEEDIDFDGFWAWLKSTLFLPAILMI